jgi:hypothetical protein
MIAKMLKVIKTRSNVCGVPLLTRSRDMIGRQNFPMRKQSTGGSSYLVAKVELSQVNIGIILGAVVLRILRWIGIMFLTSDDGTMAPYSGCHRTF